MHKCDRSPSAGDLETSTRLKAGYRVLILSKDCWEKQGEEKQEEKEEVGVKHVLQLILRSKR